MFFMNSATPLALRDDGLDVPGARIDLHQGRECSLASSAVTRGVNATVADP